LDDDAEWNLDEVLGVESSSDLEGDEWNFNEVRGLESSSSLDEDVELNLTEVPGLEPSSDLDEDVESNLHKVPGLESEEIEDHYEPTRHVFVSFLSLFYFFPLRYFIGTLLVVNLGKCSEKHNTPKLLLQTKLLKTICQKISVKVSDKRTMVKPFQNQEKVHICFRKVLENFRGNVS
jgi:hypothetical protein